MPHRIGDEADQERLWALFLHHPSRFLTAAPSPKSPSSSLSFQLSTSAGICLITLLARTSEQEPSRNKFVPEIHLPLETQSLKVEAWDTSLNPRKLFIYDAYLFFVIDFQVSHSVLVLIAEKKKSYNSIVLIKTRLPTKPFIPTVLRDAMKVLLELSRSILLLTGSECPERYSTRTFRPVDEKVFRH